MTNPQDAYTLRIIEQLEQWLASLDDEVEVVCWFVNEFSELIPFGQVKHNCRNCLNKVDCYTKNLIPAFEAKQPIDNDHNPQSQVDGDTAINYEVDFPNDSEIPFQPDPIRE